MSEEKIAVVIPTFNRADLLSRTLDSVFTQTRTAAEVVVVDDGSTDGTTAYLATLDVTTLANPGGGWGPARARDEGLKQISSDLVAFLDSDDLLLPNALAQLGAALEATPEAPFAFGRSLLASHDDDGWHPAGLMTADPAELERPLQSLFGRNFVPSPGTLARVADVKRIGGYPSAVRWAEDHYFWIRLAQIADPIFVPAVTSVYRMHGGNRHTSTLAGAELESFLALAAGDKRLATGLPQRLGVHLCETVTEALRAHRPQECVAALRQGLGGRRSRAAIVRAACHHWRARRRWAAAGVAAWESDDRLGAWLSRY